MPDSNNKQLRSSTSNPPMARLASTSRMPKSSSARLRSSCFMVGSLLSAKMETGRRITQEKRQAAAFA